LHPRHSGLDPCKQLRQGWGVLLTSIKLYLIVKRDYLPIFLAFPL
jgi:hypothetical protein